MVDANSQQEVGAAGGGGEVGGEGGGGEVGGGGGGEVGEGTPVAWLSREASVDKDVGSVDKDVGTLVVMGDVHADEGPGVCVCVCVRACGYVCVRE
jgi:hypothetical protein